MDKHAILLVDDDDLMLLALKRVLSTIDCEVYTATNGQEALQQVVRLKPSLIIADWYMPVLDGLGLFLQIKNSPLTKHMPFVFLTTQDDPEIRIALLEIGVEDYWDKSMNLRELAVRAKRILDRFNDPNAVRHLGSTNGNNVSTLSNMQLLNNRYELLEQIGEGGMGLVFRAKDHTHNRMVALKLLRMEYVSDEAELRRFAREANAAMKVKHVHVISTEEYGLLPTGQAYIVMELLEGHSLEDELNREVPIPHKRVLKIMRQIALAVAEAHKQGVIHRDLKPSNIFIKDDYDVEPNIKVLDFGIAMLQGDMNKTRLTSPNIIMGTPTYLSPEQLKGRTGDERSDIYSLGILTYEMLTGGPPFEGDNMLIMVSHVHTPPPNITNFVDVDEWLAKLVMNMLEKEPELRPKSMVEIIETIDLNISLDR